MQRPHPAQATRPPAHRLRPGKVADRAVPAPRPRSRRPGGRAFRRRRRRPAPFLSSRSSSWSRVSPVERRKPSSAAAGASARGPLRSSRTARLSRRQPLDRQRQAARRRKRARRGHRSARPRPARRSPACFRSSRARACIRAGISSENSSISRAPAWGTQLLQTCRSDWCQAKARPSGKTATTRSTPGRHPRLRQEGQRLAPLQRRADGVGVEAVEPARRDRAASALS